MFFPYGDKELNYLKAKDPQLEAVIDQVGYIEWPVDPDLFGATVRHIVGQQISGAAQATIWQRFKTQFKNKVTAKKILDLGVADIQKLGISFRKASYIIKLAEAVQNGQIDFKKLPEMTDEEVIVQLSALPGIGPWTAQMLLLSSLMRTDVLSYGDFGIQRGLRMIYHHRKITPALFAKYRRRYSPYGTIAAFYIWEVANGSVAGYKDPG